MRFQQLKSSETNINLGKYYKENVFHTKTHKFLAYFSTKKIFQFTGDLFLHNVEKCPLIINSTVLLPMIYYYYYY